MCGIFATLHTDGDRAEFTEVRRGVRALAHRGPDGRGAHVVGPAGLGCARLAVMDPARGQQPFVSADGRTVLVGNGELYEADVLRRDLQRRGVRLHSGSDIEVALHTYLLEGIEAVARLRGMFAIAIWDGRRDELIAVRDRFGIKPLLWHQDPNGVRLASEVAAIAAVTGPLQIDTTTIGQLLTFGYLPGTATGIQGVRELAPGHVLRARPNGEVSIRALVETAFDPDPMADKKTMVRKTREALEDSVAHHLRSDVPVGAFLSSGIDSAALVALARRHGELPTFSVGVDGVVDEAEMAAQTAAVLGVEHHRRQLGPSDIFAGLADAVRHLGPIADPSAVALHQLSALAAEHVAVTLSGEGADELFGGYRVYRQPATSWPARLLPAGLRRRVHAAAAQLSPERRGRGYLLRASGGVESWYRGNATGTPDALRDELLVDRGWRNASPRSALAPSWERSRHLDEVTRMQTVDLDTWLAGNILAKADRAAMAHGLEVRVPYLDAQVWDVARRVPTRLRLAGGGTKQVLRAAVADVLPPEVVRRPKLGFPVPVGTWLRGSWGEGVAARITAGPLATTLDPQVVTRIVAEHRDGRRNHGRTVWTLLVLSTWAEQTAASALTPTTCAAV